MMRRRSGAAYDPAVVDVFLRGSADVLDEAGQVSAWDAVQAAEPAPQIVVEAGDLAAKLEASLISPISSRRSWSGTLEQWRSSPRPRPQRPTGALCSALGWFTTWAGHPQRRVG